MADNIATSPHGAACENEAPAVAATAYSVALLRRLLPEGAAVDGRDGDGRSPLWHAANKGDCGLVVHLAEQLGASVTLADGEGRSPLHAAAGDNGASGGGGHLAVVQWLAGHGGSVTQPANNGKTPLYVAAAEGHIEVVQWLAGHGGSIIEAANGGDTPLYRAAYNCHLQMVQWLAGHGGSVTQPNNHGGAPLLVAAQEGHLEVVQWLAGNGGSATQPDPIGCTPLFVAAGEGHLKVVQWLVSHGLAPVPTQPDPTSTDGFLDSPLTVALHNDDGLMWRWLLDHMRAHGITGTVSTQLPGSDASPTPVWPSGGDAVGAAG